MPWPRRGPLQAAEEEERDFYTRRAPKEWLDALEPLGTDFVKSHITDAPWLIVVFRRDYDVLPDGTRLKNYYMTESVGIAAGFLIAGFFEDRYPAAQNDPLSRIMPIFIATRAIKPRAWPGW